ncbi:4Fe-4S binding protein [Candidatus Omnitrophota bacterium]
MAKIKITRDKCKACYLCIAHCPKGLIVIEPKFNKLGVKPAQFKNSKKQDCIGCNVCCVVCPEVCIEAFKE